MHLATVQRPYSWLDTDISLGHTYIPPGHFLVRNNSPSLHGVGHSPIDHHHPPIYNIKVSTVNVYKIESGRSVRVRSMGYCQFLDVRFNS